MTPTSRLNGEAEQYELGDEIGGVFVPFVSRPASDVDAFVSAAQSAAANGPARAGGDRATAGGGAQPDPRDARIAELEAELAAAQGAGTAGSGQPPAGT